MNIDAKCHHVRLLCNTHLYLSRCKVKIPFYCICVAWQSRHESCETVACMVVPFGYFNFHFDFDFTRTLNEQ